MGSDLRGRSALECLGLDPARKFRNARTLDTAQQRLLAVLEWLWLDSARERKADDVPMFSNEAGEALKTFKKAWVAAVLKAHGINSRCRKGAYKDLSAE